MFKKIIDNITTKVNNIKEENQYYKDLLNTSTTFKNFFPITTTNNSPSFHKIITITTECPDINKEKAKLIASLIPIPETFLTILYAKEIKTNKEYYLIPTNKYLWVINTSCYGAFPYNNTTNCKIIKNNLMSKTILLNNILLEVTGNDNKINTLISILTNNQEREQIIKNKTNYLCGITPTYQNINNIYSGISLDNQDNIIFHTKNNNYKKNITDILYYEVLYDNTVVLSNKVNNNITNFNTGAYQISLRITTNDNNNFIIPILEPNSFGNKYQRNDNTFQKSLNFTKELIAKIDTIIKKN